MELKAGHFTSSQWRPYGARKRPTAALKKMINRHDWLCDAEPQVLASFGARQFNRSSIQAFVQFTRHRIAVFSNLRLRRAVGHNHAAPSPHGQPLKV
jgi:hypothetical protein